MKKYTYEYVKQFFKDQGYTLLANYYVNSKTKMPYICPKHPHITQYTIFNSFVRGHRCPLCADNTHSKLHKKHKHVDIEKAFTKRGYKLITKEYKNTLQKLEYECLKHKGTSRKITYKSFLNGHGCTDCGYERVKARLLKTEEEFLKEFNKTEASKRIEIIGDYVGHVRKIKCRCKIHNIVFQSLAGALLKEGRIGCIKCGAENRAERRKYTFEEVKQIYTDNDCTLLTKTYRDCRQKLKFKCNKHGDHIQAIPFYMFIQGTRCKFCGCGLSKSEIQILEFLQNNDLSYRSEYKFKDCVDKLPLPFDFVVFDRDDSIHTIIEADGEGHYMPVCFGGIDYEVAAKNHESTKRHDEIKTQYCLDNKIKLLRIPYWNFKNIDEILKNELKDLLIANERVGDFCYVG